MTQVRTEDVRAHVVAELGDAFAGCGIDAAQLPAGFDLLDAGLIDSFGILELVSGVEQRFDVEIDFDELDPEGLTVLDTFCAFVAKQVNAARGT